MTSTPAIVGRAASQLAYAKAGIYAQAAQEPVALWDLPDVDHTQAINERPAEYEQRVVDSFDSALLAN